MFTLSAAFRHRQYCAMIIFAMKLSNILQRLLLILKQTKNYARIVGVILFAIGLIGFAFRSDSSLPDKYLVGAIVLGFWGIVSGLLDGDQNNELAIEAKPEPEIPTQASEVNETSSESTQI